LRLEQQAGEGDPLAGIPTVKLNRFAAEARALNAARMNLVAEQKRYALVTALVFQQRARAYDDGAEMLIRQVHKIHNRVKERLQNTQAENAERSTSLVRTLRDVALAYQSDGSSDDRLGAIGALIGPAVDDLVRRCDEQSASATAQSSASAAAVLPASANRSDAAAGETASDLDNQDKRVEEAIRFVLGNKDSRADKCRSQRRCAGGMVQSARSHCSI
jgi:hypothetical protein